MILFIVKSKIGNSRNTETKESKYPRKLQKHAKTPWETVENGQETGKDKIDGMTMKITQKTKWTGFNNSACIYFAPKL